MHPDPGEARDAGVDVSDPGVWSTYPSPSGTAAGFIGPADTGVVAKCSAAGRTVTVGVPAPSRHSRRAPAPRRRCSPRAPARPRFKVGVLNRDGVLERAMPIARVVGHPGATGRAPAGVEPPLDLAEHQPEQEMAPGRLQEAGRLPRELGQLSPGRMEAVGDRDEWPCEEVLREADGRSAQHGRQRQPRPDVGVVAPNRAPLPTCIASPTGSQASRVTALPSSSRSE